MLKQAPFVCVFPAGGAALGNVTGTTSPRSARSLTGTMPGKAVVTVALQPSGNDATAAPQKSFPFVLKKIMDIPPPNILEEGDDGKIKTLKRAPRLPLCFCRVNQL